MIVIGHCRWILMALFPSTPLLANHELLDRDLLRGEALYFEQCASCHGENLEGQKDWRTPKIDGTLPAPPHDKTGHTWHHNNQLLFWYTKLGGQGLMERQGVQGFSSAMPSFEEKLTDNDIWNILGYIHSQWPAEIKEAHAQRNPQH